MAPASKPVGGAVEAEAVSPATMAVNHSVQQDAIKLDEHGRALNLNLNTSSHFLNGVP